jgi:hypothetical protein
MFDKILEKHAKKVFEELPPHIIEEMDKKEKMNGCVDEAIVILEAMLHTNSTDQNDIKLALSKLLLARKLRKEIKQEQVKQVKKLVKLSMGSIVGPQLKTSKILKDDLK